MVLEGEGAREGDQGIRLPRQPSSFSRSLERRLATTLGELMGFLEACAMGNSGRVAELLEKGVDVNTLGSPLSPEVVIYYIAEPRGAMGY